ncbi:unnamed protein product [Rotaria sp. Silwood2]|nr:unnamed protein product [Rotaria sp. Silwood2]CAF4374851.1 unnamed protein product [Rotaria sp. Silwood2]
MYSPKRDCGTKYNLYLLYPNQPKNSFANYSRHIDIFDKITLTYLESWYLSIPFQFLPVNRIATQLFIQTTTMISPLCPLFCGEHGRYSGSHCTIKDNCSCSSDSYCLTSSICVCPMNKFGSKCYLKSLICQTSNPCQNNGLCISVDDSIALNNFACLCTESFYGTRCENIKNRIDITFNDEKIVLSQLSILTNRSYITLNCTILDMILKVLVTSNDWLYEFVALERVVIVIKGVRFNKVKSKQMAK